jgi:acyl-CoA reductase-like NAD-dependent aldehyde dehydrogenase
MSKMGKNFIAGSWHNGHTNVENINPSDIGDVIGHYVQAHCVRLNTALDASRSVQGEWTTTALEARQTILMSIGNELIERRIEFLTPLSREKGKSLTNWVGEVSRTGQFFTCHAAGNPE